MGYLLDSNIVIALMAGHRAALLRTAAQRPEQVFLSSIVQHELMFGAFNGAHVERNLKRLSMLAFPVLSFESSDALAAGEIRAKLKRAGTPVGPYDLLIAGQALARNLILVTANTREFERVEGLTLENWIAA